MMVFWILAGAIVLLLVAVLIFACNKLFEIAIVRGKKLIGNEGALEQLGEHKDVWDKAMEFYASLPKEDVYITSFDGLKLHGTLIKNGNAKKLLIEAHGFRSYGAHDFGVALPYFYEKGFSFLLIDQRAHGESEGEYITYGVFERFDVRRWAYFAREKLGEDVEILLHGISMGASTVLMASELELPENVKGILADSGFVSPYDIFVSVLDKIYNLKPFPVLNIANMISKKKAGFGFKDASTIDAMYTNKLPVLFVHGEDDDFVPIEMSEAAYEACVAEKDFVRIVGAKHACGYLANRELCEDAINKFIAKTITNE